MERKTESFEEKLSRIRKKIPQQNQQYVDYGKLPPQALNVEEAVLGCDNAGKGCPS
jgi:hypothetical protein